MLWTKQMASNLLVFDTEPPTDLCSKTYQGFRWVAVDSAVTPRPGEGYLIDDDGTSLSITLDDAIFAVGEAVSFCGIGTGTWSVVIPTGVVVYLSSSTLTGPGTLDGVQFTSFTLMCVRSGEFLVRDQQGTLQTF